MSGENRCDQPGQVAVEEQGAVVDHDHPAAERLDIGHVVAGEQDRRAGAAVVLGDERADPALHRHVQPDRRLVQEEHPRLVEQRAGDLALHPLAEREVAHRLLDDLADLEQVDQLVPPGPEIVRVGMRKIARLSSKESSTGMSQVSWLRWPMISAIWLR